MSHTYFVDLERPPPYYRGARALIVNYRGQTGGRKVGAVSGGGALTQIEEKLSCMNTLMSVVLLAILV